MTIVYTRQEVETVVNLARENPEGFLRLTQKYCPPGRVHDVKRSMRAWRIHYNEEGDANSSSNRTPRRWQKHRN